ncbi:MAG: type III secretion system export apparatus subunit SctU [Verrucomicrobia bacterium]|nr:type III secretion system export apparatus subunit SctU [Verrucomicrobiota bacterium]MBS0646433.1 type III secretion system export apparatus subunit SctU [Verrucomicrobiota bacterium]
MAEKTEKATPKKLKDARKKGQVAKSQDFPSAMTFVTALALTLSLTHFLYQEMAGFMLICFKAAPTTNLQDTAPFFIKEMIMVILRASLPIAVLVAIVGLIVGFLVVGPTFATEVFKPDIKRFNVVNNLKEKFKMKTVIELLKSVFKIFGAALIIYLISKQYIGELTATIALQPLTSFALLGKIIFKVVMAIGVYFFMIAVFDLVYQRMSFAKQMKMEKFEVKQEYKDSEGNPEIKGKRRQLAQEIAYDEGTSQIRRAKTIVTNPKDIAAAIGYEPERYKAPWIIAMGSGQQALAIIHLAEKYNIPIMRNVPLAHELLDVGEVNKFIPESTYEAIGEILMYLESLGPKQTEEG